MDLDCKSHYDCLCNMDIGGICIMLASAGWGELLVFKVYTLLLCRVGRRRVGIRFGMIGCCSCYGV